MPLAKLCAPLRVLDRRGDPLPGLLPALRPAPVTALTGAGGKTAVMLALGAELAAEGHTVSVAATTRMRPVAGPLPANLRAEGVPLPESKLGPPADLPALIAARDFVLLEADGARMLPAKAPTAYEPVLPEEAGMVIALQGVSAYGRPIGQVCHRPEIVCALLGKRPEDFFTPEDGAFLLLSGSGQHKNVGARRFAIVLNQADGPGELRAAFRAAALIPPEIPVLITAFPADQLLIP